MRRSGRATAMTTLSNKVASMPGPVQGYVSESASASSFAMRGPSCSASGATEPSTTIARHRNCLLICGGPSTEPLETQHNLFGISRTIAQAGPMLPDRSANTAGSFLRCNERGTAIRLMSGAPRYPPACRKPSSPGRKISTSHQCARTRRYIVRPQSP